MAVVYIGSSSSCTPGTVEAGGTIAGVSAGVGVGVLVGLLPVPEPADGVLPVGCLEGVFPGEGDMTSDEESIALTISTLTVTSIF